MNLICKFTKDTSILQGAAEGEVSDISLMCVSVHVNGLAFAAQAESWERLTLSSSKGKQQSSRAAK